jgi:hypothetical protein
VLSLAYPDHAANIAVTGSRAREGHETGFRAAWRRGAGARSWFVVTTACSFAFTVFLGRTLPDPMHSVPKSVSLLLVRGVENLSLLVPTFDDWTRWPHLVMERPRNGATPGVAMGSTSATQAMLAVGIRVPLSSWAGVDATSLPITAGLSGAAAVINAMEVDPNPQQVIAILADTISSFMSMAMRCPRTQNVARVISLIAGTGALPGVDLIQVEAQTNLIPSCAMRVSRSDELGPLASYAPTGACNCYFDYVATGASSCARCSKASDCPGSTPVYNVSLPVSFCESQ